RAAVLDRQAAGGLPLIRGPTGVGRDHLDAHVRDVELLGRYLRKRGQDALAELAFAGEHRDRARGVDADPAVQHAGRVEAAGKSGTRRLLGEDGRRAPAESDGDAAGGLEKVAAFDHAAPFAARSTARMIRLWVPQRQRLAASAARTSASCGCGLRLSRSAAAMIMPLAQ